MSKHFGSGKSLYFVLALLATISSSARADEICGKVFGLDEIPEAAPALRRAGSLGGIRKAAQSEPEEIRELVEILLRYKASERLNNGFNDTLFQKMVITPEIVSELTYYLVSRAGDGNVYYQVDRISADPKFMPIWLNVIREFDATPGADHGYYAGSMHGAFLKAIAAHDPAKFLSLAQDFVAGITANPVQSSAMANNYAWSLNQTARISLRSYTLLSQLKQVPGLKLDYQGSRKTYPKPIEKPVSAEDRATAVNLLRFYGESNFDISTRDGALVVSSDPETFLEFGQMLIAMRDPNALKPWDPMPVTESSAGVTEANRLLSDPTVSPKTAMEIKKALESVSRDTAMTIMDNWLNATIMDPTADSRREEVRRKASGFLSFVSDTASTDLASHLILGKLIQLGRFFSSSTLDSMTWDYNNYRER